MKIKSLSYIDIQHDALSVFDDVEQGIVLQEDIWISAYEVGESSVHGKMRVSLDGGVNIACRDGVKVARESKVDTLICLHGAAYLHYMSPPLVYGDGVDCGLLPLSGQLFLDVANFLVTFPSLNIASRPVHFPRQTIVPPYTKSSAVSPELSINALDYSHKAGKLVVGGPDGYAVVLDPSKPTECLQLKGHVGDVLDVKWFPSGEVVLTASSDMSLRIFSAVTGVNPRVLRGHTRAITATHILGVGRQVLSAAKDGSARLWNVGAGSQERAWRLTQPIESLVVVEGEQAAALGADEIFIAAITDGSLHGFAVDSDSDEPLFTTPPTDSKLVCAAYSPSLRLIATGHTDGTVALRRLSNLSEPVVVVRRNEASVYSLAFDGPSLLVGTAKVAEEYAGWEAVGVEAWAVGDGAWCAGADGVLRRY